MQSVLATSYSFNHLARQVTFASPIPHEAIVSINHVVSGRTIYDPRRPGRSGTLSGAVLTLEFDTANVDFADTDKLQIFVDDAVNGGGSPVAIVSDVSVSGGQLTAPAANVDLLTGQASGWYDAKNAHSVAIQVQTGAGISAGVVTFEQTNNPTVSPNGNALFCLDLAASASNPASTLALVASTSRIFGAPVLARYVRARVSTTVVGGTVQATAIFSQLPFASPIVNVQQATGSSLVSNATVAQLPTSAASADSLANPTISQVGADAMLFNGSTWDRQRANINVTTGDSGAKTATGNGATQTNFNARGAILAFIIGTVTGTSPTCQFKLQGSGDGGTTWYDIPGAVTASITASGTYVLAVYPGATVAANAAASYPLPRTWRVVWTIGGTTPSFTITGVQVSYIN